jgi:hypothetical protein
MVTRSEHGAFLVITSGVVREKGAARKDELIRLDVYPWGEFNAYEGVTTPNKYRVAGPEWGVSLPSREWSDLLACPLPLVTEDGKYLVLLGDTTFSDPALRIYRRGEQPNTEGVLVRQIKLQEVWPADKLPAASETQVATDLSEPKWYTGGTFTFSMDRRTLTYTSRWETTVHINLASGAVFRR